MLALQRFLAFGREECYTPVLVTAMTAFIKQSEGASANIFKTLLEGMFPNHSLGEVKEPESKCHDASYAQYSIR